MRVVVTGATGNVGWGVVRALSADPAVDEVVGLARRRATVDLPKVGWERADVRASDLEHWFRGADAVVHLAWALQSSHDPQVLEAVNVGGSRRVFEAVARAGVSTLVYASSIGAYSAGPGSGRVDETWPTDGIDRSTYSRQKSAVEAMLDDFVPTHPQVRTVRLRKALVFQPDAATEIAGLFLGRLRVLTPLVSSRRVPLVPADRDLTFQTVHSDDAADAYRRAVLDTDARGAYNVAAEPVLDPVALADALGARQVPFPSRALRPVANTLWRLRLIAAEPGWIDLARGAPVMDTTRIRSELGWRPVHDAASTLRGLLDGFHRRADGPTPPLAG